jgi:hypothetical protein
VRLLIHEGISPHVNSNEESSLKEWRRWYDLEARKVVFSHEENYSKQQGDMKANI